MKSIISNKAILPYVLVGYAATINTLTAYAFHNDKQRALHHEWRIPEKSLCALGLLGGWPAGYWAMHQFRHKTKKTTFRNQFFTVTTLNIGIVGLLDHRLRGGSPLMIQQLLVSSLSSRSKQQQRSLLRTGNELNQRQKDLLHAKTWTQAQKKTSQSQSTQSSQSPQSQSSSTSLSQLRSLSPNLTMPILILDLDETLLHSFLKIPEPQHAHLYQYSLNVYIDNVPVTFYVSERPYLKNFMKKVCDWYQVVIFTASVRQYADPVIDRLYYSDRITARYFRESCSQYEGMFIKDLKTVCGHSGLSRCVILDNSPISYMWNKENAIPCEAWMGENENDTELLNLLPFLDALRYTTDVRNVLRLRLGYP